MSDAWDTAGYIASSRYRAAVCEFLDSDGPELPSRISARLELAQPHVSRALSELRDRGVVELLVSESQQKGRLYGLTSTGEAALLRLRGEASTLSVSFVAADAFPYPPLLEYLRREHAGTLRLAIARDGDESDVFVASEEVSDQYDERSLSTVVTAFREDAPREASEDLPPGRRRFVVRGFEHALLIRLPVADGREVFVSLDRDADVRVDSFVESCRRRLSN